MRLIDKDEIIEPSSCLVSASQFPMFTVKILITEELYSSAAALLNLNKICQDHSFLSEQEGCLTRVFRLFHKLRDLTVDWLSEPHCRLENN